MFSRPETYKDARHSLLKKALINFVQKVYQSSNENSISCKTRRVPYQQLNSRGRRCGACSITPHKTNPLPFGLIT